MHTIRLYLVTALVLMCAVAATAQRGAGKGGRESAAAEVPAAPEDGGPRNWEVTGVSRSLNLREQPATTARILASYPPGTILDNLGCQRAERRVWCDVQQLGGGPRGYASAEILRSAQARASSMQPGISPVRSPSANR
jgi:hypothetical protein